jgi:phage tail-like protein
MSPLTTRPPQDPLRNFLFKLEIGGIARAGFNEVTIAAATTDPIEHRTGEQEAHLQKIPGLTKFGNITLKYGMTDSTDLDEWRQQVVDGDPAEQVRKDVFILALDGHGDEKARLHVIRAWPNEVKYSDFSSKGNDVALQSVTLVHEGITRV